MKDRDHEHYRWAAIHFFNQLELVAYSVNHKFVGKRGVAYLEPWLRRELVHIYNSKTQSLVFVSAVKSLDAPEAFKEILKFEPFPADKRYMFDTESESVRSNTVDIVTLLSDAPAPIPDRQ